MQLRDGREAVDYIDAVRTRLLKEIDGLPVDALDWKPVEPSITIGGLLAHIAGVQLVLTGAVCERHRIDISDDGLFEGVVPGLWRQLGGEQPRAHDLSHYRAQLAAVLVKTKSCLETAPDWHVDPELLHGQIEKVRRHLPDRQLADRSISQSLAQDIAKGRNLPFVLRDHEHYHLGQITYIKFLWGQWRRDHTT